LAKRPVLGFMAPISPQGDRIYGAVDVFLKRDAMSARRASESCSLTTLRAFTGSKIGNVIVQGCDWSKIKRTRVRTTLSIKVTVRVGFFHLKQCSTDLLRLKNRWQFVGHAFVDSGEDDFNVVARSKTKIHRQRMSQCKVRPHSLPSWRYN
jgi:hypothetical protein